MGAETKAVWPGTSPFERIVALLKSEVVGAIAVRDMQRPKYKLVEFQKVDRLTDTDLVV